MDFIETTAEELLGPLNDVERKNAPELLHAAGDLKLLRMPRVSIVGTRKPSTEGIRLVQSVVQTLIQQQLVIVSGLAEGIDTVAHTEAIHHGGKTIAVLGTALDHFYPKSNERLQRTIMREHLAISQFAPGMRGSKSSFPARNRTMALLSHATVIIEAGEKSGTEHQGWEAIRLGRPLFVSELVARQQFSWVDKLLYYGAEVLETGSEEVMFDVVPILPHDANEQVAF